MQQRIDTHVRQLFEEYDGILPYYTILPSILTLLLLLAISKDVMSNVQEMLQQVHTRLKQHCDQLVENYTNSLEEIRRVEQEQGRE